MPGLAKALKRKRQNAAPTRLDAIFDWHTRFVLASIATHEGRPGLVVGVHCTDEQFARYRREVRRATSARIRTVEDAFALDLFGPRRSIGRLFTSQAEDNVLPITVARIDADGGDALELHLVHATEKLDAEVLRLPIAIDRVTLEEFHGDLVEIGEGEYCTTTVSAHDGTIFVHRFESKEEAEAQLEKNIAANEPFVDADLN